MGKIYCHQHSRCWINSEHRLLFMGLNEEMVKLEGFSKGENELEKPVGSTSSIDEAKRRAVDRIRGIGERGGFKGWMQRMRGSFASRNGWRKSITWSKEGVHKEELHAKIEKIARERLAGIKASGDAKLGRIAEKSKPSILLLRLKRDVCAEIIGDLGKEIEQKTALQESFDKMGDLLDDPGMTTEGLRQNKDLVTTIQEEIQGKIEGTKEGKLTEQIDQLDTELRRTLALAGVDMDLDEKIEKCLMAKNQERALATLMEEIQDKVKDPTLLRNCKKALQRIVGIDKGFYVRRGLPIGQKYLAAVGANYYMQREQQLQSQNEATDINGRMEKLAKAKPLQKVSLGGEEYTILHNAGGYVHLRKGTKLAIIEQSSKKIRMKDTSVSSPSSVDKTLDNTSIPSGKNGRDAIYFKLL